MALFFEPFICLLKPYYPHFFQQIQRILFYDIIKVLLQNQGYAISLYVKEIKKDLKARTISFFLITNFLYF